jgi:hypothetical protein
MTDEEEFSARSQLKWTREGDAWILLYRRRRMGRVVPDKNHPGMWRSYTAEKQPAVFFATCARLLPNDVRVTVEQSIPGNLSMEEWQMMKEIIAAVRQAIPDAAGAPPGAVLEHVLTALRAADAKVLDSSENN